MKLMTIFLIPLLLAACPSPQAEAEGTVQEAAIQASGEAVKQITDCEPTEEWVRGAAWSGKSIAPPDDMTAADTQVGETACRAWGPQSGTDVFAGGSITPKRAASE